MPESAGCCRCCCNFIFTLGLTALFMWLSLRTSNPTCSVQEFYLPALNKSLNFPRNNTLHFHLKLDNGNKEKGIYYDAINLNFSYTPNNISFLPIGNKTISPFYQGHKKKAKRIDNIETSGVNWEAVSRAVSNGTVVVFRVDLATAVRFKIMAWKTKRHKIMVRANVTVNDQGTKDKKKGIKLKSGALMHECYRALLGMLLIFSLLFLNF